MSKPLHLFEGTGIELEYMIVDRGTLDVQPIADQLLHAVGGSYDVEVDMGPVAWSNELALHVIEIKTNGPVPSLAGVAAELQAHVGKIGALLSPMGARLLPGGMHPWMDPERELRLWNHENDIIYATFDRIFDCRGHGWANLQSMHINLPFCGDDEFGRLHAAIRLVLPILPALAASSPFIEGRRGEALDCRLRVYRDNARRVPSVSGSVVPERVFTRADYEGKLLQGIYADLAPHDPEGVLRHEWVNARGAIARFDRMAIEIRLLDTQECPAADLAIAALVTAAVRALTEERHCDLSTQQGWDEARLSQLLRACEADGDRTPIADRDYLAAFGYDAGDTPTAGKLWEHIATHVLDLTGNAAEHASALSVIFEQGCLARRIVERAGPAPSPEALRRVYGQLAACLAEGRPFTAQTA